MMHQHIRQARTSKICGQACIAMLAGVPLADVVRVIGHRRGTKHREILDAARRFGLTPATKLWRLADDLDGKTFPDHCIIKVRRPRRRNWHWIAIIDGVASDPMRSSAGEADLSHAVSYMEFMRDDA